MVREIYFTMFDKDFIERQIIVEYEFHDGYVYFNEVLIEIGGGVMQEIPYVNLLKHFNNDVLARIDKHIDLEINKTT